MGQATHRFQNASGILQTRLSPYRVAELAHSQSPPTPTPTLRYEGADEGLMQFSIRGVGGVTEQMSFVVRIETTMVGCDVKTDIGTFTTVQQKVGFVPAGRKQLMGYKQYKMFFDRLVRQVLAEDPTARAHFNEMG